MRKVSTSVMVALAVVAMLWGNCLSCPEMMTSAHSDHSCCPKPQQNSVGCHTESLRQFVQDDVQAPSVPAVAEIAPLPAPLTLPLQWERAPLPAQYLPPGSPTLPTALRI